MNIGHLFIEVHGTLQTVMYNSSGLVRLEHTTCQWATDQRKEIDEQKITE
jgi:hypothetical protein